MIKGNSVTPKILLFLFFIDGLETFIHFCFKKTALLESNFQIQSFFDAFIFVKAMLWAPFLWVGLAGVLVIFIFWSTILSRIDLSVAVPVCSFSYITIPLVSIFFFHEKVAPLRWCGIASIIIGIVLVSLSSKDEKGLL